MVTAHFVEDAVVKQNLLTGLEISLCMKKLLGLKGNEASGCEKEGNFGSDFSVQITKLRGRDEVHYLLRTTRPYQTHPFISLSLYIYLYGADCTWSATNREQESDAKHSLGLLLYCILIHFYLWTKKRPLSLDDVFCLHPNPKTRNTVPSLENTRTLQTSGHTAVPNTALSP